MRASEFLIGHSKGSIKLVYQYIKKVSYLMYRNANLNIIVIISVVLP
jgi:hypothetical protein